MDCILSWDRLKPDHTRVCHGYVILSDMNHPFVQSFSQIEKSRSTAGIGPDRRGSGSPGRAEDGRAGADWAT